MKARLDIETVEKLDAYCTINITDRSKVIRDAIHRILGRKWYKHSTDDEAIVDFDMQALRATFIQDHAAQEGKDELYGIITSMDNSRFNPLNDETIEVFVAQQDVTFSDSPLKAYETEKLYLMKKEAEDWRIFSITN